MLREELMKEIRDDYYESLKRRDYNEVEEIKKKVVEVLDESEKEWIPKYKFLKDLRKKGTDSNEIYREWKKNNM